MNKTKLILLIFTIAFNIVSGTPIHNQLDNRIIGLSFGGELNDDEASRDGLGAIALQHHSGSSQINNELILQNKLTDLLSSAGVTDEQNDNLLSEILDGNLGNQDEIISILPNAGFNIDGTSCNDNDNLTANDVYVNGICAGNSFCDDNDINTDDSVVDGVCVFNPIITSNNTCAGGFDDTYTNWMPCSSTTPVLDGLLNWNLTDNSNTTQDGMWITSQSGLTNIDGLSSLVNPNFNIQIENSPNLIDISGLANLRNHGGYLSLFNNSGISDYSPLSNLNSVNTLRLSPSNSVNNLDFLNNLSYIRDNLYLFGDNITINNVDFMSNISNTLTGSIYIYGLHNLQNISGLNNVSLATDRIIGIPSTSNYTNILHYTGNYVKMPNLNVKMNSNSSICQKLRSGANKLCVVDTTPSSTSNSCLVVSFSIIIQESFISKVCY